MKTTITFVLEATKIIFRKTNLFCEHKEKSRDSCTDHSSNAVSRCNLNILINMYHGCLPLYIVFQKYDQYYTIDVSLVVIGVSKSPSPSPSSIWSQENERQGQDISLYSLPLAQQRLKCQWKNQLGVGESLFVAKRKNTIFFPWKLLHTLF